MFFFGNKGAMNISNQFRLVPVNFFLHLRCRIASNKRCGIEVFWIKEITNWPTHWLIDLTHRKSFAIWRCSWLLVCSCWLSNVNLVILFVWNLGEKIFRSCNNNCKFWFKNPCEFCRRTTPVIQIQIHYCCKSSMRHSNTTFYLKVILQ